MKLIAKNISFHPRLAGGLDFVFGLFFLWWLTQVNTWWMLLLWVFVRLTMWLVLVRFAYFSAKLNRWSHLLSLVIFGAGVLLLLMFIEWAVAWRVVGAAFVLFPALSFWFLPSKEVELSFEFKPYRRWRFLLSVFGLMGIESGLLATAAFQLFYGVNNSAWWIVLAFFPTAVSYWWWREYGVGKTRTMLIWLGALFILLFEFCAILMLWPIGFLAGGLLIVWWWYVLWLLIRFHLSPGGIIWKKQKLFLFFNTIAMLAFLLVGVRWK